ncbi:MAG: tetratricopeptide repeat protein [Planctomycetia bacterium]|nr:tetratricopeptide repeat protein [Planctomycetia bacterium]
MRLFKQVGLIIIVLALQMVAGCGTMPRQPTHQTPVEETAHLTPAQTSDVQISLASSLENRGELDPAIEMYEKAVKQDPKRTDAILRLAILHGKQGRLSESESMFRKVLTLKPQEAQAHGGLGYSLYLQGRMSDAEVSIRRAVEIEPENKRYRNNLALVLARSGKNKEALEEYIRSGCTAIEAQNNLAFALTLEGNIPEAKKQYQQLLAESPAHAVARVGLQHLEIVAMKDKRMGDQAVNNSSQLTPVSYVEPVTKQSGNKP